MPGTPKTITEADCTASKLGTTIPISSIGEPVSGVTLSEPRWTTAADDHPAFCSIDGSMAPVDTSATAKPINFRVLFPQSWRYRSIQWGGGGMNGFIRIGKYPYPQGYVKYGSDSGHQGEPLPVNLQDWALNEEAIRNLGYMQMKKTHDAAMVLIERMYGERPRFNYYFGASQGGREGLMVSQRYPADYDGIVSSVPIVDFSSLMLAHVWIRIQEKKLANWVTPAKIRAIRSEFIRQCDKLDGLADGIINNYMACRAIFDVRQGAPGRDPWAAKRCPNNIDPNPADTSSNACLTKGQVATLNFVYSRYQFSTPLANGRSSFGMWLPDVDPSEGASMASEFHAQLIESTRFKGQEGAAESAQTFSHVGAAGVAGFLMQNLQANPLDYVESALDRRRQQISPWLDATNPDLTAFYRRGGKLIVAIGTNDTMASPGDQLDYFQALVDTMGQARVDEFARLFVVPQGDHELTGNNYSVDGNGKTIPSAPIPTPNLAQLIEWLIDWVENNNAPSKAPTVKVWVEDDTRPSKSPRVDDRSLPLCSYPMYPRYVHGPTNLASSYRCALP